MNVFIRWAYILYLHTRSMALASSHPNEKKRRKEKTNASLKLDLKYFQTSFQNKSQIIINMQNIKNDGGRGRGSLSKYKYKWTNKYYTVYFNCMYKLRWARKTKKVVVSLYFVSSPCPPSPPLFIFFSFVHFESAISMIALPKHYYGKSTR